MESFLVDPAVLGQFVDALIAEKYPGQPAAAYAGVKEDAIKALDYQILKSILGQLTKEQGQELNKLLAKNDSDPAAYEDFFKSRGINLEEVLTNTMVKFKDDFLGGDNA